MAEEEVPTDHPRSTSLRARQRLVDGIERGLTSRHGLIAHGRGEALDYLLGERTLLEARMASRAGAAALLLADRPVISVNGNVAALDPDGVVRLAAATDSVIEVNLFHRSPERVRAITDHLQAHGADDVLGTGADAALPGLSHDRGIVHEAGIYAADVVLVPLEDGDRAAALDELGKTEIVIDLNPLSRSAVIADIPVCDNLLRALPEMVSAASDLAGSTPSDLRAIVDRFDPDTAREAAERAIRTGDLEAMPGQRNDL